MKITTFNPPVLPQQQAKVQLPVDAQTAPLSTVFPKATDTVQFSGLFAKKKKDEPKDEPKNEAPKAPPEPPAAPAEPVKPPAPPTADEIIEGMKTKELDFQKHIDAQLQRYRRTLQILVENQSKLETLKKQEASLESKTLSLMEQIKAVENGTGAKLSRTQLDKVKYEQQRWLRSLAIATIQRQKIEEHVARADDASRLQQTQLEEFKLRLEELHYKIEDFEMALNIAASDKESIKLAEELAAAIGNSGANDSELSKLFEAAQKYINEVEVDRRMAESNGSLTNDVEVAEMKLRAEMAALSSGGMTSDLEKQLEEKLAKKMNGEQNAEEGKSASSSQGGNSAG